LESEIHVFEFRQRVLINERDLKVISMFVLLPSVSFADGPCARISELFCIHEARRGVVPINFADVDQLQLLRYTPQ
jgi:hypothetical protein